MRYPVPQGLGEPLIVLPGNPAAGANLIYPLPAGYRYQLKSLIFTFVTDATVSNRNCILQVTSGVPNTLWEITQQYNHAANTTVTYCFSDHGYSTSTLMAARLYADVPVTMSLLAGWVVRTAINNLQAGDQLSVSAIVFHRWEESAP